MCPRRPCVLQVLIVWRAVHCILDQSRVECQSGLKICFSSQVIVIQDKADPRSPVTTMISPFWHRTDKLFDLHRLSQWQ